MFDSTLGEGSQQLALHGMLIISDQRLSLPAALPVCQFRNRPVVYGALIGKAAWWTDAQGATVQFFQRGDDIAELQELLMHDGDVLASALADVMQQLETGVDVGYAHLQRSGQDVDGYLLRLAELLAQGQDEQYAIPRRLLKADQVHH